MGNDSSAWEISLPELARLIGGSQQTLLTAFREQLGMTLQSHLIAYRIHLARRLLKRSTPHRTTVSAVISVKASGECPLPDDAFAHARTAATFGKILVDYVRDRKAESLPDVIA